MDLRELKRLTHPLCFEDIDENRDMLEGCPHWDNAICLNCETELKNIITLIKEHIKGISPVNEWEGMNEYYDDGFKTCVGAILLAIIVALEVNNE